jgi:hypothetical protein
MRWKVAFWYNLGFIYHILQNAWWASYGFHFNLLLFEWKFQNMQSCDFLGRLTYVWFFHPTPTTHKRCFLMQHICQHVQQNSKYRTQVAQRDAGYIINLQLSYTRHQLIYIILQVWSLQSSPFTVKLWSSVYGCSITLIHSDLASGYFLLACLIQICSPQFCKWFMQTISSRVHHKKKEPNEETLILHTSNQVQVCFSGHLGSCLWDCCCSGICHWPEKMHYARIQSTGIVSEVVHYEHEKWSTNSSLRLTSFSIDGLIVPLSWLPSRRLFKLWKP